MRVPFGLVCFLALGVFTLLSGCATTADSVFERAISLERVASQHAEVTHVYLVHEDGAFTVRGQLTKRYGMRGTIAGHLHVSVVDSSGEVVSDTRIGYTRRSAQSRTATFFLKLPVEPPHGSTVQISHHGIGHGLPHSG
jgi:hypothetical protein